MRTLWVWCGLSLATVGLGSGCGVAPSDDAEVSDSEVQRGVDASADPELTGVVVIDTPDGGFCTATMIAPTVALTARHCVLSERAFLRLPGKFEVPSLPVTRRVRNTLFIGPRSGGFVGWGLDAAILTIDAPFPSKYAVRPIPVRTTPLGEADVGKRLTAVGYGIRTVQDFGAYRVLPNLVKGPLTLQAVNGKPFHRLFATKSDFRSYVTELENASVADRLDEAYDFELSKPGYEIYAGMGSGDAETCAGDSGGPLLERVDGHYEVVGLLSGGFYGETHPTRSPRNGCILGSVYASFGPELAQALAKSVPPSPPQPGYEGRAPQTWVTCTDTFDKRDGRIGNVSTTCEGGVVTYCYGSPLSSMQYVEDCAAAGMVCRPGSGLCWKP